MAVLLQPGTDSRATAVPAPETLHIATAPYFAAPSVITTPRPAAKVSPVKKTAVQPKMVKKKTATKRVRANLDRGILPSAYRGPYYDARYEAKRRCIVKRESEGRYGARNKSSGAAGAYQFMPPWLRTIQKWTGEHKPIYAMSRYAQDLAFWKAFNHGKGARNWAGGRWAC